MENKKCPICNGCMDQYWIGPDMYFYCWFCKKYFRLSNHKFIEVEKPNVGG
jgi:hypothetical protein